MRDFLLLYLNGEKLEVRGEAVFGTLSTFLREERGAKGTKIVCEEGDCGACTVLVGTPENGELVYRPINSCILQLYQLDSTHVVTVEGVSAKGSLSPLQEAMVTHHGAQCGFCTPGFITAMTALYEAPGELTERVVREGLTGNLCRCTGYEPILKAALAVDRESIARLCDLYPSEALVQDLERAGTEPVHIQSGDLDLHSPTTLAEAVKVRSRTPAPIIVQGATDMGVWRNKRSFEPTAVLSVSRIPELKVLAESDGVIEVGGAVTLAAFESFIRDRIPELAVIMERFGAPQIRNAGTLAGNVANASPIADTLPFLFVMGAQVELAGPRGTRLVEIGSFYKGYKSLDMGSDELISRILFPLPGTDERLRLYKLSRRRDLDISSFTAAVRLTGTGGRIGTVRIAYGGVGPVVLRLPRTEAWLTGREIEEETFREAGRLAREEIDPISDVRGSREYRLQLAENILLKFYHDLAGSEVYA